MKCIYPDCITAISADEADADYPVSNLQDYHPKNVWKGTSRDAVITAICSSGGALAVIATNATSATLTISQGQTWTQESGWTMDAGWSLDTTGDSDVTSTVILPGDISGCAWFDFATARTSSFTATLTLTAAAGQIIQAGVVRCGTVYTFRDPSRGIQEGLEDYSVEKQLNNGAWYTRDRDTVRTFDFSMFAERDPDFYSFMSTVAKNVKSKPIPWRILTSGTTDSRWIAFAKFNGRMPSGSHSLPSYSQIDVSLLEVL